LLRPGGLFEVQTACRRDPDRPIFLYPAQTHVLENALDLSRKVVARRSQTFGPQLGPDSGLKFWREDLAFEEIEHPELFAKLVFVGGPTLRKIPIGAVGTVLRDEFLPF